MTVVDPHSPVLIGIGQQTWRDGNVSRTPIDALTEVVSMALQDTGICSIAESIDCVTTVRFIADTNPAIASLFPRNPGAAIAERLNLPSAQILQGAIGGNSPQYLVNQLAQKLYEGHCSVAVLAGAELFATFFSALKKGEDISSWADGAEDQPTTLGTDRDGLNEVEKSHGLYEPINTYPLFENAIRHHEKHSFEEHQKLLGDICSEMSCVAARNPLAWRQNHLSPSEIREATPDNRMIGHPYTKLMNAVLSVDMAAAIVMTTAGKALELGIDEDRLVFLRAGVDVNEIWHISERENFYSSPGLGKAAAAALRHANLAVDQIDCFDIYSCFPSAVEIACREIGISPLDSRGVTVTGGLPYFGGPGNNYSLHAIAEMVSRLRNDGEDNGFISANGLYLTKHSLGVYSSQPPAKKWIPFDSKPLQQEIDQGPRTYLEKDYEGEVSIETCTVAHGKDGPKEGYIIARNKAGNRIIANTGQDGDTLERLMVTLMVADPVGIRGHVERKGGRTIFSF